MQTVSFNNLSQQSIQGIIDSFSANGVTASAQVDPAGGNSMTITLTGANGVTQSIAVNFVAIDGPGDAASAELEDLTALLDEMAAGLTSPSTPPSVGFPPSGLFQLFEIMNLMLEVAQKQRQTYAAMQQADHAKIQASLESQYEAGMQAAAQAYGEAINGCIFQAVMTGVSTVMSIASIGMSIKGMASSDVNSTKADLKAATADLKGAQKLDGDSTLTMTKSEAESLGIKLDADGVKVDGDTVTVPREAAMKAMSEKGAISEQTMEQRAKVVDDQKQVANLKGEIDTAKQQRTDLQTQLDGDKAKLQTAKSDLAKLEGTKPDPSKPDEVKAHTDAIANKKAEITKLEESIGANETAVEKINVKLEKQLEPDLEKAQMTAAKDAASYKNALEADLEANASSGKVPNELLQKVVKAETAGMKQTMVEGLEIQTNKAREAYGQSLDSIRNSKEMKWADNLSSFSQILNSVGNTAASFYQAESQKIQQEASALQKMYESNQEGLRADLDAVKELYAQTADMMSSIRQSLLAILNAEAQANTFA